MDQIKYVVYREGEYFVSQALNVDVSSFGKSVEEAVAQLKEAVELYLEDEAGRAQFHMVGEALVGVVAIDAQAA